MLLRAISVGLDVQERLAFLQRLEELEARMEQRKNDRWPA